MIAVMRAMEARLGEGLFTSDDVWAKLGTLYDLQMLDENVRNDLCTKCD